MHRDRRPVFEQTSFETFLKKVEIHSRGCRTNELFGGNGFTERPSDGERQRNVVIHIGPGRPELCEGRLVVSFPDHAASGEMLCRSSGPKGKGPPDRFRARPPANGVS